jgi:pyruvate dehydrogenase E1 component alpha subunit
VDGNDVEAVFDATSRAAARCRASEGPVLLELLTYRQTGHSRRDPRLYQPDAEKKEWAARDPIEVLAARLQAEGVADEAEIEEMRARAAQCFAVAVEKARAAPLPSAGDLETDVFVEAAS